MSPAPRARGGLALSGDHDRVLCASAAPGLTDLSARGPAAGAEGPRPGWAEALPAAFTEYAVRVPDGHRVVVDPDARNEKAIARFTGRQGFGPGPAVVLPRHPSPSSSPVTLPHHSPTSTFRMGTRPQTTLNCHFPPGR